MTVSATSPTVDSETPAPSIAWVIAASSAGTLIEWYDFYLYGTMSVYLGGLFFPRIAHSGTFGLLLSLATLGIGFVVRPLGGLVFGSLGDRGGRKYSFLLTLGLMGLSTTCMGLLPSYERAGAVAPALLLLLRIVQGLAAGGEVGGAVAYVVENAPDHRRGWYLGVLYTMSPLGALLSVSIVHVCHVATGPTMFAVWGWRLPFLFSSVLVLLSLVFRLRLRETPVFEVLRRTHAAARSPVRELFTGRENVTRMLVAVFGSTAGQGALGITALGFSLSFMQAILKVDVGTTSKVLQLATLLALPFYLVFGWLSDRVGRKPMILLGLCLGIVFYVPIYHGMQMDVAPLRFWRLVFLSWAQILFVAITLAPTVAALSETFPTRLRSTGVAVSYNFSNGLLNGFAPLIGFALIADTGSIYSGLAYPIGISLVTVMVCIAFMKETAGTSLR